VPKKLHGAKVLIYKPIGQLVKKFAAFCTAWFIAVFTNGHILSQMCPVYTLPPCLGIHFNDHHHEVGFPGIFFLFTCSELSHPCYMPVNLHLMKLTVSGERYAIISSAPSSQIFSFCICSEQIRAVANPGYVL